jgi:hypothetical protein
MKTCFNCRHTTDGSLDLWGYPVCRNCAARIGLKGPHTAGSCRGLEQVPPTTDSLDALLAIWIAQSMLDSPGR